MTDFTAISGPVRLSLLPEAARFSLRVGRANLNKASEAFGASLPERIGGRVSEGPRSALCLGPEEWVLHTSNDDAPALTAAFAGLGFGTPHSLVDISDRECAIAISGQQAADLLSTSCPRDLSAIPAGSGTRTLFDTVPVALFKDSETEYRLECWRSYLPHVWGLLATANRELASGL